MSDSYLSSHQRPQSSQGQISNTDLQRILNLHDLGLLPKRALADTQVNRSSTWLWFSLHHSHFVIPGRRESSDCILYLLKSLGPWNACKGLT